MNAKQRKTIAARIVAIATAHGAAVETHGPLPRHPGITVDATFPDVMVSIDVDDLHRGGLMANWHRARRPLAFAPFDSVNECHRMKATQYRPNAEAFFEAFERAAQAVASGAAFDDNWSKPART